MPCLEESFPTVLLLLSPITKWLPRRITGPQGRCLHAGRATDENRGLWLCSNVWLNQYSSQLLPILALIGLRLFVGLGDRILRLVTKPKKDPMQARRPLTPRHPRICVITHERISKT